MSPQLSLRRQQVSEKLNEWAVFNEKNKELCEWLTQMESKVSQNGDISIEEMIEKLRKVISAHSLNQKYTCTYVETNEHNTSMHAEVLS